MYATLRAKVLENTQRPLPLNPEDAQSGGNALCQAHSRGFRGYRAFEQHFEKMSSAQRQTTAQRSVAAQLGDESDDESDDERNEDEGGGWVHAELMKHMRCTPSLQPDVKRPRLEEVQTDEITKPPLIKLSGLPRTHPDGAAKTLDSSAKLKEKFTGATEGFPLYYGPPPFKGEAVLVFASPADDHATAFTMAVEWRNAVNRKLSEESDAELGPNATASFVTRSELDMWRDESGRNKGHWSEKLFKRYGGQHSGAAGTVAGGLQFVNLQTELQRQQARREAERQQQKELEGRLASQQVELDAASQRAAEQKRELETLKEDARKAEEHEKELITKLRADNEKMMVEQLQSLDERMNNLLLARRRQQDVLLAQKDAADAKARTLEERVRLNSNEVERIQMMLREKERDLAAFIDQAAAARHEAIGQATAQATAQAMEDAAARERAQKERVAADVSAHFEDEIAQLKAHLEKSKAEVDECEKDERNNNIIKSEHFAMNSALQHIDYELLSAEWNPLLELEMTNEVPSWPKAGSVRRFYIREFGMMQPYEAHALGIDVMQDIEWMAWLSYDSDSPSPLEAEAIKDNGVVVGFIEKDQLRQVVAMGDTSKFSEAQLAMVKKERSFTVKAKLVPAIRKKYGRKKGDRIIAFLVKMHNEYLKHPGRGYAVSKVLWDRNLPYPNKDGTKDGPMSWEDKVKFYMTHMKSNAVEHVYVPG